MQRMNQPQRPRYIAPSTHVIATRLTQNTADRITVGNTPLHILHLCDAQYLAPLFSSCCSLTAITVHLKYVASSTALEVFLQGAATCPSLRDVSLIGGATAMEAAAMSAGLAAFKCSSKQTSSPWTGAQHPQRRQGDTRLPLRTAVQKHAAVPSRSSPHLSHPPSSAASSSLQAFESARVRPCFRGGPPKASPQPHFSCPLSPACLLEEQRPGRLWPRREQGRRQLTSRGAEARCRTPFSAHSSPSAGALAHTPAFGSCPNGVHVTLELHRVSDDTSAALLEGLRRASRVLSVAVHLCVSSADARLAGLRFAHKAKQVTLQHRRELQQLRSLQSVCTAGCSPRPPSGVSPIYLKINEANSKAIDLQQTHVTSGPPTSPTHRGHRPFFLPRRGRFSTGVADARAPFTPPSSSLAFYGQRPPSARYGVWAPTTRAAVQQQPAPPPSLGAFAPHTPAGVHVAPHTPPFAQMAGAGCTQQQSCEDAFWRRGRHFFSSERRRASAVAAAVAELVGNVPQAPRLRYKGVVPCGPAAQPKRVFTESAQTSPSSLTGKVQAQPPVQMHVVRPASGHAVALSASSAASLSSSSSSSFSPLVLEAARFHCGRSSSFSTWSSRSTSPQPRPPHTPQASTSSAFCSARYCLNRGRHVLCGGAHGHVSPCGSGRATHTRTGAVRRPTPPSSSARHCAACSCFVCAHPPPSPHTPTASRYRARREMLDGALVLATTPSSRTKPSLPSSPSPPSAPSSSVVHGSPSSSSSRAVAVAPAAIPEVAPTPRRSSLHQDCQAPRPGKESCAALSATFFKRLAATSCCEAKTQGEASDSIKSASVSTPGITARTPAEPRGRRRPYDDAGAGQNRDADDLRRWSATSRSSRHLVKQGMNGSASAAPPASQQSSCPVESMSSYQKEASTSTDAATDSTEEQESSGSSVADSVGYVVYQNSLKFLRARVAEINSHVVWHQVKAAQEAEAHAKRLAAVEAVFAGRVTEQLSDILMVLTDMEHGSRCRRT